MDEESVSAHMIKNSLVLSQRHRNGKTSTKPKPKPKRRATRAGEEAQNSCMLWRSVSVCECVRGAGQGGGAGRAECGPTCCLATRAARPDAGFIIIVNMPTERGKGKGRGRGRGRGIGRGKERGKDGKRG